MPVAASLHAPCEPPSPDHAILCRTRVVPRSISNRSPSPFAPNLTRTPPFSTTAGTHPPRRASATSASPSIDFCPFLPREGAGCAGLSPYVPDAPW